MNLICIVRKGKNLSHTLASIKFSQFGESTNIPYIICDTWEEGFLQANQNYRYGLFVDAGTVFYDIQQFVNKLSNYPQQGLVGHIVDPKDKDNYYWLHPQCFLLEMKYFNQTLFGNCLTKPTATVPIRSTKNIHDDYTPLWIKKTSQCATFKNSEFGSDLINHFLKSKNIVSNFSVSLRELKKFIYNTQIEEDWLKYNKEYIEIATNQLWILNNEEIDLTFRNKKIVCPGSGFFWMLAAQTDVQEIDIVDISLVQIKFVNALLDKWNGNDYGGFVIDFMKENSVIHYNLDRDISKLDRLKFNNRDLLRKYINEKVKPIDWEKIKSKKINLFNENIIFYVLKNKPTDMDIWMSNILNYKFTFLTTPYEDIENFKKHLAL